MDLSKAYECLSPNLLMNKLKAYGLDMSSLSLINIYLTNLPLKVIGSNSYVEFPRFHYFSISLLMIYFLRFRNPKFMSLQIIIRYNIVAMTWKMLLKT